MSDGDDEENKGEVECGLDNSPKARGIRREV